MVCKKCGSSNVKVMPVTETKGGGRGFFATLLNIILIVCTCGLWLIVPLLHHKKVKSKTIYKHICQNCGYAW